MSACIPQHYEATQKSPVEGDVKGVRSVSLPASSAVAYDKHKALVTVEGQHVIITTNSL
jgi:hypothetical protein